MYKLRLRIIKRSYNIGGKVLITYSKPVSFCFKNKKGLTIYYYISLLMLIIISIAWTPADFKKNYTLPFSEKNVLMCYTLALL